MSDSDGDDDSDSDSDDSDDYYIRKNQDDSEDEYFPYAFVLAVVIPRLNQLMSQEWDSVSITELEQLLHQCPYAVQGYTETYKTYALHEACHRNAPLAVVRAIYKAWPDTIQMCEWPMGTTTRWSSPLRHPLEIALTNSTVPLDVIQFLLQQCPESIQLPFAKGGTALHWAIQTGVSLPVIKLLVQQWPKALHLK